MALLSFGVGICTSLFALSDPILAGRLPYPAHEQLVSLSVAVTNPHAGRPEDVPVLADWAARHNLFQAVDGYSLLGQVRFESQSEAFLLRTAAVGESFFRLLGVPDRCAPIARDRTNCLVLTARAFARHFGHNPVAVGRPFQTSDVEDRSEGELVRLVSILPDGFVLPFPNVALELETEALLVRPSSDKRVTDYTRILARLQPTVDVEAARVALRSLIIPALGVEVQPLGESLSDRNQPLARAILWLAIAVLALCACSGVLLLAGRFATRSLEFRIRVALGATRRHLALLVVYEMGLVAAFVVASGGLLATVLLAGLTRVAPEQYVVLGAPTMSWRAWIFVGLTGTTAVAFCGGLAAAVTRSRVWFQEHEATFHPRRRPVRMALVTVESLLAVVIFAAGVQTAWSLLAIVTERAGFSGRVLVVPVYYPGDFFGPSTRVAIDETLTRLVRQPGVEAVAATTGAVVERRYSFGVWQVSNVEVTVDSCQVTNQYLNAAGGKLLSGQWFDAITDGNRAIVVNETFTRHAWVNTHEAIGQFVRMGEFTLGPIVGVIRDEPVHGLNVRPRPTLYVPLDKLPRCINCSTLVNYLVRLQPGGVLGDVSRLIRGVTPRTVVGAGEWVRQRLFQSVKYQAFASIVIQLLGFLAAGVCLCGVAGTASMVAAEQQRETAIRIALGAARAQVVRAQAQGTALALVAGAATGVILGRMLSIAIVQRLPGTMAGGWTWAVIGAVAVVAIAGAGLLVPAWRAASMPPAAMLRRLADG